MTEYDQINLWPEAVAGRPLLSARQEAFVLSAFPTGSRLTGIAPFPGRSGPPLGVQVALPDGQETSAVLRMSRTLDGVETEARLLPVLARLGLSVPELLAGPFYDPDAPEIGAISLLSRLRGDSLQDLSFAENVGVARAGEMIQEAVAGLQGVTDAVARTPEADPLPRRSLLTELRDIVHRGGPWLGQPLIRSALRQLVPVLARVETPLAFSSGDYNPANFLSDGARLTGIIDFENACFEDPVYGFSKYPVYDMYPFAKSGLIERVLERRGMTAADFAPRLAVRCLWTLQREIAVFPEGAKPETWEAALANDGAAQADYLRHVFLLLRDALEDGG